MNGSVGKRCAFDMFPTKLRIPLTIEVIYFETPLLFNLKSIENILQIAAIGTVRSKVLYKLEGRTIIIYLLRELLVAN